VANDSRINRSRVDMTGRQATGAALPKKHVPALGHRQPRAQMAQAFCVFGQQLRKFLDAVNARRAELAGHDAN
jgi:hypothetical protein